MVRWWSRKPNDAAFSDALASYGRAKCGVKGKTLLLGLGAQSFNTPAVATGLGDDIPPFDTIKFLDAKNQIDLIRAFLTAPQAQQVTGLEIGSNLDVAHNGQRDYREAVALLAHADLSALQHLRLGDMYLTYNAQALYGCVGDLTGPLTALPTLKTLAIHGAFDLSGPLDLPALESLTIRPMDDVAGYGGMPSQNTITQLLTSRMPGLTRLAFEGDLDEPITYRLPDAVLSGAAFPNLSQVTFTHVAPEQAQALQDLNSRPEKGGP